jgi:hypothetical protein
MAGLDFQLEQQIKRLKEAFETAKRAEIEKRRKEWEIVRTRWEESDEN